MQSGRAVPAPTQTAPTSVTAKDEFSLFTSKDLRSKDGIPNPETSNANVAEWQHMQWATQRVGQSSYPVTNPFDPFYQQHSMNTVPYIS